MAVTAVELLLYISTSTVWVSHALPVQCGCPMHCRGIIPLTKVAGLLYEYACHEGNYGMFNILRGARAEEARAAESTN